MTAAHDPAPAYPPGTAYIDGDFRPISEAKISVLDWGLLRSDATYDVVHVWRGRFFRLELHLDRFLNSVARLRLELPFGRAQLTATLMQCVRRSGLADAYVEMICTAATPPTSAAIRAPPSIGSSPSPSRSVGWPMRNSGNAACTSR